MNAPGVLFYVQHLLGIGHLKRAVVLARAMRQAGLRVTLVSGGEAVPVIDAAGIDMVQLPPARAADMSFRVLLGADGKPVDEAWRTARRDRLLEVFHAVAPRVVIVELFPFGRRQMRFELLPLLDAARAANPRPKVVSSVRDILVEKADSRRNREMVEVALDRFDTVLVHGDPALIPFDDTFPFARELGERLVYTGYVVDAPVALQGPPPVRRGVLVSAGGGAVGDGLLRLALAARPLTRMAGEPWRLLAGDNLPEAAFRELAAQAPAGVAVERARRDFVALMAASALSVSQGGYNTVVETLATGTRAVIVPYAGGEESEQTIRARLLARRGLLTTVDEAGLTAERLAAAIDAALDLRPAATSGPRLDGAAETARIVAGLAGADA